MKTLIQLIRKKKKVKPAKRKRLALEKCPQKKATCLKVYTMTPRKPNSALRKVTWVLFSNYKRVHAYIPGIGHSLQKHSVVLIRGGRVKDLPGMKYIIIRGKFDLKAVINRRKARSKYGGRKIYHRVDHRYFKFKYW
jgi:small subunit ribosomal protein S12